MISAQEVDANYAELSDRIAAPAKVNPGRWAMLKGLVAWHLKRRRGDNPYPEGSPGGRCWAHGFTVLGRGRDKTVTRETIAKPGRGRAVTGDRREWSRADIALLRFCSGGEGPVETRELAAILGRPEQGVRGKRHRLAKAEGKL